MIEKNRGSGYQTYNFTCTFVPLFWIQIVFVRLHVQESVTATAVSLSEYKLYPWSSLCIHPEGASKQEDRTKNGVLTSQWSYQLPENDLTVNQRQRDPNLKVNGVVLDLTTCHRY